MFRSTVCMLAIFLTAAATDSAQEIPFTLEKGFILISGKAKKEFSIEAAVYTGSAYSFYNDDTLKRLRLQISSTNDLLTSGANTEQSVTFANVPSVTIANQKPVEVKMRPGAFDRMVKAVGRNIDVILGADYFDGKIVQLDFKNRMLRFLDKPMVDYDSAKSVTSTEGPTRLVFKMDGHIQTVFGNIVTLPIADEVMLSGTKAPALFNTGVALPVLVGPFTAKKVTFAAEKDANGKTQLPKVALGNYEFSDVPAWIANDWDDNEKRYAAIIGLGIMQNFTVTFDWKNKWIILEK